MSVTIPAGRINRLFGTDGGVMLSLYADFPAQFDTGTPLLVTIDALEVSNATRTKTTNSTWKT